MKKLIIATALMASFSATAARVEAGSGQFNFGAKVDPVCSLHVVKDYADISFTNNETLENLAEAEITSDMAKKIFVTVSRDWKDKEIWGGKTPDSLASTFAEGDVVGGYEAGGSHLLEFEDEFNMVVKNNQKVKYFMSVQAEEATQSGTAHMNAVVQFACE